MSYYVHIHEHEVHETVYFMDLVCSHTLIHLLKSQLLYIRNTRMLDIVGEREQASPHVYLEWLMHYIHE